MRKVLIVAVVWCLGVAVPAWAQGVPPGPGSPASRQSKPKANWSLKGHVSLQVSGGYDLDVFGNILATTPVAGVRETDTFIQPLAVLATAYPDAFVKTPRRGQISVGFGIFGRDELFARVNRSTANAQPIGVGTDDLKMTATISQYKDETIEFGLRHYFNTGATRRIYVALSGGKRTVEPISVELVPDFGGTLGSLRFYDRSRVTTMGLEFGATFEIHHVGVFFEGGGRFQGKLKRIDDDLAVFQLDTANDTGGRLYIPVQLGIIIRM